MIEMSEARLFQFIEQRIAPDLNSGCWLWTGNTHPTGYGVISTFRPVLPAKNLRAALAEVRQSALDQGLMEGGQVSDEPTFQRYAGYEPLNIQR